MTVPQKLNIFSGQGESPYRWYSPRAVKTADPVSESNSGTDSIVWIKRKYKNAVSFYLKILSSGIFLR